MFSFFCKCCDGKRVGIVKKMTLINKLEWTNDKEKNKALSVVDFLISQGVFDRIYDIEMECSNCHKMSKVLSFIRLM